MALLEDVTKGLTSPTGLAVGIGAVILTPVLLPVVSSVARPLARAVLSTGIGLYRQTVEPVSRAMTDLVSEARQELAAGSTSAAQEEGTSTKPHRKAGKSEG